ncbi:hypothetical protein CVS40_8312 [Lucilia cuprina]|nr:hypothetical protein CVS40_8312 [Lucilia cuprina]
MTSLNDQHEVLRKSLHFLLIKKIYIYKKEFNVFYAKFSNKNVQHRKSIVIPCMQV